MRYKFTLVSKPTTSSQNVLF